MFSLVVTQKYLNTRDWLIYRALYRVVEIVLEPSAVSDLTNEVQLYVFTPVTILGSENCQSISLQNLLSASQPFQGL